MQRSQKHVWLASLLSLSLLCTVSSAGVIRDDRSDQLYLDLANNYPSVGLVSTAGWYGSGTLIASNWILTAAHVVDGATNVQFTLGDITFDATKTYTYSKWNGNLSLGYDLGLIQVSQDISAATGVDPAKLYTGTAELGKVGTYVGYGMTGTGLTGATIYDQLKRAEQNMIDVFYATPGGKTSRLLGSDFDNPHNPADSSWGSSVPLELEGLIAPGDSGGGLFINVNGVDYLAGVHSFGTTYDGNINSDYGDLSGDTRVSQFVKWIQSVIEGDGSPGNNGKGPKDKRLLDSEFEGAIVPEPGVMTLLALGGLTLLRRRRRT